VGSVRWFGFFLIVEHMGEQALAMANVVHGVYALLLLPVGGFAETVCTITSNLIGQGQPVGIGAVLRRAMGWAALCIVPFALLAFVEPALPLSLFTSDPELVTVATSSLRVVSLAILLAIPAEIIYSAVSGSGNTRTTLVIELVLSATVLSCAYAAGIVLRLPVEAVWAAEVAGWSVCLVFSAVWLTRARWSDLAI
jgi:MATE family multidrug resistance protein